MNPEQSSVLSGRRSKAALSKDAELTRVAPFDYVKNASPRVLASFTRIQAL